MKDETSDVRTAAEERADVVAWLRGAILDTSANRRWKTAIADAIERGDHVGTGEGE